MTGTPARAQADPGFELGVEVFDYKYCERFEDVTIALDRGTFVGLSARYVAALGNGWSLTAKADGANAKVDYRSDDGARLDNVSQSVGRIELVLARDIPLRRSAVLTPSVGIGARLLDDRSGGRTASDGALGYDREIFYGYLPIGLELGVPAGRTRLRIGGRYGLLLDGTAKSRFSKIDQSLPDAKLDLNGGHLLEAEATPAIPAGRHAIVVGPFVRRWTIKASDAATLPVLGTVLEPPNRTTEAGARISFRF